MKYFKIFLIFFLVFSFFPALKVSALSADVLVRGSESTLYYYAANGKRYVFPNEKAYKTWFKDYSNVVTVTDDLLATMTLGGNITYRPGIKMIKIQTDPKVYAVAKGGVLRWVKTEELAAALYGSDWNTKIDDVPDVFFINYTIGNPIETASDYNRETEYNSATTINDDKNLEKSAGALVSDTIETQVIETPPAPEPTPAPVVTETWENFRITENTSRQQNPAVTSNDSEFIAVWVDGKSGQDEIYSAFIGKDGKLSKGPYFVSQNIYNSASPSIAWSGLDAAIVWEDHTALQREIYFSRINTNGDRVIKEKGVTDKIGNAKNPKIVWNGSEYGVVWWDTRASSDIGLKGALYFQKIDKTGLMTGDNTKVNNSYVGEFSPDMIWDGEKYGVVWADDRSGNSEIYFARIDNFGVLSTEGETRITETEKSSLNPSVVWNRTSFGIVWQEEVGDATTAGKHFEIYFQKLDKDGKKVGDAVRLTSKASGDSEMPKIAKNGEKYAITWQDYRGSADKTSSEIYFMETDYNGIISKIEKNISNTTGLSIEPAITVLDGIYGLVYADDQVGDYEIYSANKK